MGIDSLELMGSRLADPLVGVGASAWTFLFGLVGAILIAVFGYIIATFIGLLVRKLLGKLKLDQWVESTGKHAALGNMSPSHILSGMLRWYVFALFLVEAAQWLQLNALTELLTKIALWVPNLILAILTLLVGLIVTDIASDKMAHASKISWIKKISGVIKFFIIIFFIDIALRQIGVSFTLAESTYLVLLTGITLAVSLAVGISLGFGLKKEAEDFVKVMKKKIR
jgi:hypothetical protein